MVTVGAIAITVSVLAVALPAYLSPASPSTGSSPPHVKIGATWSELGDYGVGIANAMILGPITVPAGTAPVGFQGNVTTLSWHRFVNGTGYVSGSCGASLPAPGACNIFLGVWTPTAWAAYAAGGSASPIWCDTAAGTSSPCVNSSTIQFSTGDQSAYDGVPWEIVVWNLVPWGLYGYVNASEVIGPGGSAG